MQKTHVQNIWVRVIYVPMTCENNSLSFMMAVIRGQHPVCMEENVLRGGGEEAKTMVSLILRKEVRLEMPDVKSMFTVPDECTYITSTF